MLVDSLEKEKLKKPFVKYSICNYDFRFFIFFDCIAENTYVHVPGGFSVQIFSKSLEFF